MTEEVLTTSDSVSVSIPSQSSLSSSKKFNVDLFPTSRSSSVPLHHAGSCLTINTSVNPYYSSVFIPDIKDEDIPCFKHVTPGKKESELAISDIAKANHSQNQNYELDQEETTTAALNPNSYFSFLDDFIRFDICRTGVSCFSGYSIGVQYDDEFLVGKGVSPCYLSAVCGSKSAVRLWHNESAFEIEYLPRASCTRPKDCQYDIKIPGRENRIGTIHFKEDLVRIYNAYEKCLSLRRKQGASCYSIKTESGDRLASVDIFRGLRGDILYYGLSILGDASAIDKALLVGLTVAMDIRQRESDMRCSLIWVPLCYVAVIGLFSLLPFLYLYDEHV